MSGYGEDLAYIHDAGFSAYALGAAPGLVRILRRSRVTGGLVVDLGCGSGRWAGELTRAGYDVLGVDLSPELLRIARRVAPQAQFVAESLWKVELPKADAVTSIGECLNYCFDRAAGRTLPGKLFARVYASLRPGGVFVFDAATPSRIPRAGPRRHWIEGDGWAVLSESEGDRRNNTLRRHIVCFRRVGGRYRRSEETHRHRLFHPRDLLAALRRAGFEAEAVSAFGRFVLPEGITGFVARKGGSGGRVG